MEPEYTQPPRRRNEETAHGWTSPRADSMLRAMHDHPGHRFDPNNFHKLDDPERQKWLPADTILEAIGVRAAMSVIDVGAGTGYFTLPLARRVGPGGRVYALDSQPEMLGHLRGKLPGLDLPIELVHAEASRLTLPDACADLVLLANVWHEIDDRAGAAHEARRVLRPGGRVAVLDWSPDCDPPPGPPRDHRFSASKVSGELSSSGFVCLEPTRVGLHSYLILAEPAL